jgi:hypothetical protein
MGARVNLDQLCVNTIRTRCGTPRASRRPIRTTERLGELSVTLDDIKHFRPLDSKGPGTSGIETTTGPWARGWPPAWAWVRRSAEGDQA